MTISQVLCDPGLLRPPPTDDVAGGARFWQGVVEWAGDSRVRLGPACQQYLAAALVNDGWPDFQPPSCPRALKRDASRALNSLLGKIAKYDRATAEGGDKGVELRFKPRYTQDAQAEMPLARDVALVARRENLTGLATSQSHWEQQALMVRCDPPPPESVPFLLRPLDPLPGEADLRVASYLEKRRLTLVGGSPADGVVRSLRARFRLSSGQIRWIQSEKGVRTNLSALDGVEIERDIVFCIAGHVGHSTREAAQAKCTSRGVLFRYAQTPSMIAELLIAEFGS